MNTKRRNVLVVVALVSLLILGGYVAFIPTGEDSKDLNTLGTITMYEWRNSAWVKVTQDYVVDASTVAEPQLWVVFTGTFKSSDVRCSLIGSDGLAKISMLATISTAGMNWRFSSTQVKSVAPDKYHFSFSGMYDASTMTGLHGVTPSFYLIGTSGTPLPPTVSTPADDVIIVTETAPIAWTYTHLLPTHYTVVVGSTVVKSGIGNVGGPSTNVNYDFMPNSAGTYQVTLKVTVDGSSVSKSDSVQVSVVGTSTTPTTTPGTTPTPTTSTTPSTGTSSSTSSTTGTGEEPTGGFEIGYFLIAGIAMVVVVYAYKKRK